jgi:primary-amine oxidase
VQTAIFKLGRLRDRLGAALPARCHGFAAGVVAFASAITLGAHWVPAHPLDPLTSQEIGIAVAELRRAGYADAAMRFALIDLDEPEKDAVLAWRPGQQVRRKAFVVARRDRAVYEAVIDLVARRVERWQELPDTQSAVLAEEWTNAQRITVADAGWRQAMARRGYGSFDKVFCAPLPAGSLLDPSEAGRRLVRVTCFDTHGTGNIRARPIEGLVATVDLDAGKVIGLIDHGAVPLSRETGDFGEQPLRPGATAPHRATGFAIDGYRVRWWGWSFRYRLDRRAGLVLSLVRHEDRGGRRLVLYRGSVAEMSVPYMDPDPAWSFRAGFDVGEHGFGWLASPLARGVDCPAEARMLDAVLPDADGRALALRSVICLFERRTDTPLWRHAESANSSYAGRPGRELVMRTIPSVGSYDYIIDWVLTEAGSIRIDVGATGIDAVKGVAAGTMADPSAAAETMHGMLVAPNLAAIYHDHFLSLRLDIDIDGAANTLIRQRLEPQPLPGGDSGRSLWTVRETPVAAEGPLPGAGQHVAPEVWRIVNPNLTNRLGQHPGYELRPGQSATSLPGAGDPAQRRSAFAAAPLWITAYDRRELYAAGDYPDQGRGGEGLPGFATRHRPVENADIVLWYTMGFHHLTRPEDWPVMATVRHSVELVPYGFFDRNPSLERRGTRERWSAAGGGR